MNRSAEFLSLLVLVSYAGISSANSCDNADQIVLREVSKILAIQEADLKISQPFSKQAVVGDALDVVESIMAVEDVLNIKIDDQKLDARIGSSGVNDLAETLTIKVLQDVAIEACKGNNK